MVSFCKGTAHSPPHETWRNGNTAEQYRCEDIYKNTRLAELTWIKLFIGKVSEESHLSKNHPSILIWYIMTSIMSLFTVKRINFYGLGSSTATSLHKNITKQIEHQTGYQYYSSVISECHTILVFNTSCWFAHNKPPSVRNIKVDIMNNILLCCIKVNLYTVHTDIFWKTSFTVLNFI